MTVLMKIYTNCCWRIWEPTIDTWYVLVQLQLFISLTYFIFRSTIFKMSRKTKVNRDDGSSKTSRCVECEIVFQPENIEECCSDCSKGTRPFINHTTDHIYVKNMLSFSDDQSQLAKISISDVGTNKIKRIRLIPGEWCLVLIL